MTQKKIGYSSLDRMGPISIGLKQTAASKKQKNVCVRYKAFFLHAFVGLISSFLHSYFLGKIILTFDAIRGIKSSLPTSTDVISSQDIILQKIHLA